VAAADKTPDPVKVATYKALSENARTYGSKLDTAGVGTLRTALAAAGGDVRSAAAEAMGSLNLPNEQAKLQILQPKGDAAPTGAAVPAAASGQ
jgi:hypothetical protein